MAHARRHGHGALPTPAPPGDPLPPRDAAIMCAAPPCALLLQIQWHGGLLLSMLFLLVLRRLGGILFLPVILFLLLVLRQPSATLFQVLPLLL
jgi:hypothetical protein